jgi:hypothetical protein
MGLYSTASRAAARHAPPPRPRRSRRYRGSVPTLTRTLLIAALSCALLAPQAMASGAPPLPVPSSSLLWATIDVCNTPAHPLTVGIRGSMPGTGDAHELMYMSFAVEYRGPAGHWRYLGAAGQSGFVKVGNGSSLARQAGQDFTIAASAPRTYVLRGAVVFQWRLQGRTIATEVRATRAGHPAAAGADPPGFSAAICKIKV